VADLINADLGTVLLDHEKRIRDLERRPMGCLEFHDHFYVVCPSLVDLPPSPLYGGHGVGYYVTQTNLVWAWEDGVWDDTRTLDDWLPDPTVPE